MIAVRKVISEDVVYENVWLDDSGSETFQVHLGSICRTFSGKGIENLEEFRNNLVDLELNSGNLVKRMTGLPERCCQLAKMELRSKVTV